MKITKEFLKSKNACSSGMQFVEQKKMFELEHEEFINLLIASNYWNWANWLISRLMNYQQRVTYAVFAAEQVINIYNKKYYTYRFYSNRPEKY